MPRVTHCLLAWLAMQLFMWAHAAARGAQCAVSFAEQASLKETASAEVATQSPSAINVAPTTIDLVNRVRM